MKQSGFQLVSETALGRGENLGVWVHERVAYVATASCATGIKAIDVSDPARPKLLPSLFSDPLSRHGDAMAITASTADFRGELLAVALESCFTGSTFATGIQFWDVTEPEFPRRLALFTTAAPVRDLHLIQRGGRVYVLAALPIAETVIGPKGFRIIDASNPRRPVQIGDWGINQELGLNAVNTGRGNSASVHANSLSVNKSGTVAHVSYWDAGVVALDISDPALPQLISRTSYGQDEEGNAAFAVASDDGRFVFAGDQVDLSGDGELEIIEPRIGFGPFPTSNTFYVSPLCTIGEITGEVVRMSAPSIAVPPSSRTEPDVRGKIALIAASNFLVEWSEWIDYAYKNGAIGVIVVGVRGTTPFQLAFPGVGMQSQHGAQLMNLAATTPVRVRVRAKARSWGFVRVYDASTSRPQVATIKNARTDECPSMEEARYGVRQLFLETNTLYTTWETEGLKAFDVSDPARPVPTSSFVPTSIGRPGNVSQKPSLRGIFAADGLVYVTEANRGLYILRPDSADPPSFSISAGGGNSISIAGTLAMQTGFAEVSTPTSGRPGVLTIVGFRHNDALAGEMVIPSLTPLSRGRFFAEVQASVTTGIALTNPNAGPATVSLSCFDDSVASGAASEVVLPPRSQISGYVNERPFNGGSAFRGTCTVVSTAPIGITVLRIRTNERRVPLLSLLPVADLSLAQEDPVVIPHGADGGGWSTRIVLINPADTVLSGTIQRFDLEGSSRYTIAPRAALAIETPNTAGNARTGFVRIVPEPGSRAPEAFAVLSYRKADVTLMETSIHAVVPGKSARLYFERRRHPAAAVDTNIAIVNTSSSTAAVLVEFYDLSGARITGANVSVPANGQIVTSLQQISGLDTIPQAMRGFVRISHATANIALAGIRSWSNEKREPAIISAIAPLPSTIPASPSPVLLPLWVDGGGYSSQFVPFSAGEIPSATLKLFLQNGRPADVRLQ